MNLSTKHFVTIGVILQLFLTPLYATGLYTMSRDVQDRGTAGVSGITTTDSPMGLFNNPAVLSTLSGTQLAVGVTTLSLDVPFKNKGTTLPTTMGGGNVVGPPRKDIPLTFLPNLAASWEITDRLHVGAGTSIVFGGGGSNFGEEWFGRYFVQEAAFGVLESSLSASYSLTPKIAIGFSINHDYAAQESKQAIYLGPNTDDAQATFSGDGYDIGYTLGLLANLTPKTKLGLTYTSPTTPEMTGKTTYEGAPFTNSDTTVTYKLPAQIRLGLWHSFTPRWGVGADVNWQGWSRFDVVTSQLEKPPIQGAPTKAETPFYWKDIVRYGIGTEYIVTSYWKVRAGVSYNPTPTTDQYRDISVPQEDNILMSLGMSNAFTNRFYMDWAYQVSMALRSAEINYTTPSSGTLKTDTIPDMQFFLVQANYRF